MTPLHYIDQLHFELSFEGEPMAESELFDWITHEILPLIDEVLDEYDDPAQIWRIETLELNLGTISQAYFAYEIGRLLFDKLHAQMSELRSMRNSPLMASQVQRTEFDYLAQFLRSGTLNWQVAHDTRRAHSILLRKVLTGQFAPALKALLHEETVLLRLVQQYDSDCLTDVVQTLLGQWPIQVAASWLGWLPGVMQQDKSAAFWLMLLSHVRGDAVDLEAALALSDLSQGALPRPGHDTSPIGDRFIPLVSTTEGASRPETEFARWPEIPDEHVTSGATEQQLRQWLHWSLQAGIVGAQTRRQMLDAINEAMAQSRDRVRFLQQILLAIKQGQEIDLELCLARAAVNLESQTDAMVLADQAPAISPHHELEKMAVSGQGTTHDATETAIEPTGAEVWGSSDTAGNTAADAVAILDVFTPPQISANKPANTPPNISDSQGDVSLQGLSRDVAVTCALSPGYADHTRMPEPRSSLFKETDALKLSDKKDSLPASTSVTQKNDECAVEEQFVQWRNQEGSREVPIADEQQLRQWLNWSLQDEAGTVQMHKLMWDTIDQALEQSRNRVGVLQQVLMTIKQGKELDPELITAVAADVDATPLKAQFPARLHDTRIDNAVPQNHTVINDVAQFRGEISQEPEIDDATAITDTASDVVTVVGKLSLLLEKYAVQKDQLVPAVRNGLAAIWEQLQADGQLLQHLNSAQLHYLLHAGLAIRSNGTNQIPFIQAVEMQATRAGDVAGYFRRVLSAMLLQQDLDLEQFVNKQLDERYSILGQIIRPVMTTYEGGVEHLEASATDNKLAMLMPAHQDREEQMRGRASSPVVVQATSADQQIIRIDSTMFSALRRWLSCYVALTMPASREWLVALENRVGSTTLKSHYWMLLLNCVLKRMSASHRVALEEMLDQQFAQDKRSLLQTSLHLASSPDNVKLLNEIEFCFLQDGQAVALADWAGDQAMPPRLATNTNMAPAVTSDNQAAQVAAPVAHAAVFPARLQGTTGQAITEPQVSPFSSESDFTSPSGMAIESIPTPQPATAQVTEGGSAQESEQLPYRLAQALLRTGLGSLQGIWFQVCTAHADILRVALRRYAQKAEVQQVLLARTEPKILLELLQAVAPEAFLVLRNVQDCLPQLLAASDKSNQHDAIAKQLLAVSLTRAIDTEKLSADSLLDDLMACFLVTLQSADTPEPLAQWQHLQLRQLRQLGQIWLDELDSVQAQPLTSLLQKRVLGQRYAASLLRRLGVMDEDWAEITPYSTEENCRQGQRDLADESVDCRLIMRAMVRSCPELMQNFFVQLARRGVDHAQFSGAEWLELLGILLSRLEPAAQTQFWQQQWQYLLANTTIADEDRQPDNVGLGMRLDGTELESFCKQNLTIQLRNFDRGGAAGENASQEEIRGRQTDGRVLAFGEAVQPENGILASFAAVPSATFSSALPVQEQKLVLVPDPEPHLMVQAPDSETGDEAALALILQRQREPNSEQQTLFILRLERLLAGGVADAPRFDGSLQAALASPQAIQRLQRLLPVSTQIRLLKKINPRAATLLPEILAHLTKVLPVPVPARAGFVWKLIYTILMVDHCPAERLALRLALINALAQHYRFADASLWQKLAQVEPDASAAQGEMQFPHRVGSRAADLTLPNAVMPGNIISTASIPLVPATETLGDIAIHNGGLVLIAPYISRLFDLLELTESNCFIHQEAATRAVHLLQFVVAGECETPEYELVLNKVLCGIHGGQPLPRNIQISTSEQEVIEQMLNGVIQNWGALGNTSISGLRETFLQRRAHLHWQNDAWQLKVDKSAFDVLLDRLPWSFSVIKLPWMHAPIHVTWR